MSPKAAWLSREIELTGVLSFIAKNVSTWYLPCTAPGLVFYFQALRALIGTTIQSNLTSRSHYFLSCGGHAGSE